MVSTAARSGKVRGARWDEIELDSWEWRIPDHRMKAGVAHTVPLPAGALEQAQTLNDGSPLLFPSPIKPGRPLSGVTLTKPLRETDLAERADVRSDLFQQRAEFMQQWADFKERNDG